MSNYDDRQAAKAQRLNERAAKLRAEGEAQAESARQFFYNLNGQPMLPGHYSYRADVNRRAKNRAKWDRGIENQNAAAELERRASAVGSAGVASDDPAAVTKLRKKLAWIDEQRAEIKAINTIVRRHAPKLKPGPDYDANALATELDAAGFGRSQIAEAIKEDFTGRVGIEKWQLENKTAEARRITKRIAELEAMHEAAKADPAEWSGDGWNMWADHTEGRIFLKIEGGRLTRDSFTAIRSAGGFNWSRRDERYVRKITPNALSAAERLAPRLAEMIEFA